MFRRVFGGFGNAAGSVGGLAAAGGLMSGGVALPSSSIANSSKRHIFAEKVRAGHVIRLDNKYWRVVSNTRSQKGQMAASFTVKMVKVGESSRTKEQVCSSSFELPDVRYERVRTLFSGFDDEDNACFVYPEHSMDAGREINIQANSLPVWQQQWLAVRQPVDVLHIFAEAEDEPEFYGDVIIPTNWIYTIDKVRMKGMYKLASFLECDGECTIGDAVNVGDKIKVVVRTDGTASYSGRAVE